MRTGIKKTTTATMEKLIEKILVQNSKANLILYFFTRIVLY